MLDRSTIRPNNLYWVKRRKCDDKPTLAFVSGELPSLSIKPLDPQSYPSCSDYDFLGAADVDKMFDATFHGLTVGDLVPYKVEPS